MLILKADKVVCFAILLQVLILKRLMGKNQSHRNGANRLAILQVLKMNDLEPAEHRRYRESPQYYPKDTIRQVPIFVKMKKVVTKKRASAPAFG
ncbi:MAG TPA: hypothetical protein VKH63_12175 [Candidatus Acidoferrum sp.]|jgi:hypothetical protein|nr:hypothetical protein [Candidatus Acidoferrum sp.]